MFQTSKAAQYGARRAVELASRQSISCFNKSLPKSTLQSSRNTRLRIKKGSCLEQIWLPNYKNFSTRSNSEGSGIASRLVGVLNSAFTNHPHETCVSMLSMEILSIYGTHSLLVYSGIHVPVEFALAFAMSRPFRRLRLPLELAGAAALSHFFPSLRRIKVTALSRVFPEVMRSHFREGKLKAGAENFGRIVDKYGASYFISARWLGVSVVCLIYSAIANGVNVSSYLEQYGFGGYGEVVGTWAAAVTLSATLYPATIVCGGGLAHILARLRLQFLKR
mmetsp:Transcript_13876/g.15810  ORF Transcript_13876/g.15810 Transcript_13876/m.15810 type:complete len:278 (-) Transcript_13876:731-1564(-)